MSKLRYGGMLFTLWCGMRQRCYDSNHAAFHRYGGRGIRVCDEWLKSFSAFKAWAIENGHSPGLQIDRIKNSGNYEPGNCEFVTPKKNIRNSSVVKLNEGKVAEIKGLLSCGEKRQDIARRYSVVPRTVDSIRMGETWGDVQPLPPFLVFLP